MYNQREKKQKKKNIGFVHNLKQTNGSCFNCVYLSWKMCTWKGYCGVTRFAFCSSTVLGVTSVSPMKSG